MLTTVFTCPNYFSALVSLLLVQHKISNDVTIRILRTDIFEILHVDFIKGLNHTGLNFVNLNTIMVSISNTR